MANETESLGIEILRRLQGDIAELKTGQQDVRHRLSLIEVRLAGTEHNLAEQYSGYAGRSVRIDQLERIERIERRLDLTE